MKRCILGALSVLLALTACSPGQDKLVDKPAAEVLVAAAASLADALKEAQTLFEAEHPPVRIRLNLGSSGGLQQQIEQGAPVDLFIAAAAGPMEALVQKGLVDQGAVTNLAANRVVLVRPRSGGGINDWHDLAGAKRVAMGNPQHVPAGQYGKAVLQGLNLWGVVEPKLVLAEDVRQVLHHVASGEVDAGIVYRTDAAASQQVEIVAEAPAGSHKPVVYPMAVLKEARHPAEAKRFADFLTSAKGREILAKYGFRAP